MKTININFEYNVPSRSDLAKLTKKQVKELLDKESERYLNYLDQVQAEINEKIDSATKGTNIIKNDALLTDNNLVDYGDTVFAFIGEQRQQELEKLNRLYNDIKEGIDIYNSIKNNDVYQSLNRDVVLLKGVFPDIDAFNNLTESLGFDIEIDYKKVINNKNHYDESVFLMLKALESQKTLTLVEA